jgi:hypothetical protein
VGSLNGRIERLEGRIGIPKAEAEREEEKRMSETRARVIAELNAFEDRIRSMSEAEREAWRNDPRRQAELRELEERIERRRRG